MTQAVGTKRGLSREEFLRRAALVGGVGALAGLGAGRASAAGLARLGTTAESGSLQVLDWSGYEVKDLWKQYAATHPDMKPKFTFMTNEANALGKMRAGFKPDVVHPCVGYVKDFADSGFVQPWDPALLKNLKHLNPAMVKAGQIGGKQWWIPADWGFDKILYRTDKVTAEGEVVEPDARRSLQGQDRVVRRPQPARLGRLLPRLQEAVRPDGRRARRNRRPCSSRRRATSACSGRPRPTCRTRSPPATSGSPTPGPPTSWR